MGCIVSNQVKEEPLEPVQHSFSSDGSSFTINGITRLDELKKSREYKEQQRIQEIIERLT